MYCIRLNHANNGSEKINTVFHKLIWISNGLDYDAKI